MSRTTRPPLPHRSPHLRPCALLASAVVLSGLAGLPAAATPAAPAVSAAERASIVDSVTRAIDETYVFEDTATRMSEHVRTRLAAGAYDDATTLDRFAEALTEDLRSISHDLHLHLFWHPNPPAGGGAGPTAEQQRRDNYCFRKVERLEGNVGYLKLDCFAPAEVAGATAVAAMGFLAGSDALIFDLRDNGGGDPSMIQLLTSYLFAPGAQHLNSFYVRRDDRTEQYWTQAWVPGERLPDVPVFVLTSGHTFSAAEEFTYNLKTLERATVVGETTGGGAHPVEFRRVAGFPLFLSLPYGRAINPISGTNWEGTGVAPDIAVPAPDALEAALAAARRQVVVDLSEQPAG